MSDDVQCHCLKDEIESALGQGEIDKMNDIFELLPGH